VYFIAHRGNINGPDKKENHPDYILKAAKKGFNVEIDVWYNNGKYILGHDKPEHEVTSDFLKNKLFWCHAKNIDGLSAMLKEQNIHCFWHQEDFFTLTSKKYIWTYPGHALTKRSICVMPEIAVKDYDASSLAQCAGICSDRIAYYKELV
jgi:hypothetical protein